MKVHHWMKAGVLLAAAAGAQYASASPPAASVTAAAPSEIVNFNVYLPLRNQQQLDELISQLHDSKSPNYQQWLTPAEFLSRFGPDAADIAKVQASLTARGLTVSKVNAHGMHVSGPASAVADALSTSVGKKTENGKTRFVAQSHIYAPSELQGMNIRVVGLESVPPHHVNSHIPAGNLPDNRYTSTGSYWFDDLKQAYDYPAYSPQTDGTGVNVAILMSDLIFPGDVQAAFDHEQFTTITGKPAPSVTTVTVDGGGSYGGPGAFEASLDTQQVLGGAPGSNVTLVSIPDLSNQSILDGYTYIVDTNTFDIVNSSFGECELEYLPAYNAGEDFTYVLKQLHEVFQQGSAQGITFVASSGDNGAVMCPSPDYGFPGAVNVTFGPGVSSPADDPYVTAVGGGNLITASSATTLNSAYVRESAFGDPELPYDIYGVGQLVSGGYWAAGGGVSQIFSKPPYQFLADTGSWQWRTVPDVGMQVGGLGFSQLNGTAPGFCDSTAISCGPDDSSVLTAYGVGIGGGFYFTIGTSVSSPEFVGALALYEQKFGKRHRQGNVNYYLYALGALQSLAGGAKAPEPLQFYHRNIPGYDGYYNGNQPSENYSYIYGNGSPDVRKLFGLTNHRPAGLPQTPSNP